MNKQAYFKLMGLQKKAGNIAGPFLGAMSGLTATDWLAHVIHGNPGFLARTLYDIPGAYLGILAGNKLQNKLQGTNRGAFWDDQTTVFWNNVLSRAEEARHKAQLKEAKGNSTEDNPVQDHVSVTASAAGEHIGS